MTDVGAHAGQSCASVVPLEPVGCVNPIRIEKPPNKAAAELSESCVQVDVPGRYCLLSQVRYILGGCGTVRGALSSAGREP
jgi:hypothetical protein